MQISIGLGKFRENIKTSASESVSYCELKHYNMHGRDEKCIQSSAQKMRGKDLAKPMRGKYQNGSQRNRVGSLTPESSGSGPRQVVSSCEHGN